MSATAMPDDDELTRYLLGELAEADEAAIDDRVADDLTWQALRRVEDDLLDAYLRDELGEQRRLRLAERIALSPRLREKVELHRDLRTIATARRRRAAQRRTVIVTTLALAAAAILLFALFGRGDGGRSQRAPEVVALSLEPTTRGGDVPAVRLSPRDTLVLTVVIDAEEIYPRYRVRIALAGAERWIATDVVASQGAIVLRVPASRLGEGVHELELTGIPTVGEPVRLGARSFSVAR